MKYRIKSWEELCEIGSYESYGAILAPPEGSLSFVELMMGLCGTKIDNLGFQTFEGGQNWTIEEWMVDEIDEDYFRLEDVSGISHATPTQYVGYLTLSEHLNQEGFAEWTECEGLVFGSNLITNKTEEEKMYSEKGLVRGAKLSCGSVLITEELVDVIKIRKSDREVFLKDGSVIGNVVSLKMAEGSMLTGWEGSDPTVKTTDTREEFCKKQGEIEELSARLNCRLIRKEEYPKRRDEIEIKYKDILPNVKHELVW